MGVIRLLLALFVVAGHIPNGIHFPTWGGSTAVEVFFVISGFYMALVLAEKYPATRSGTKLFLVNRALRLYPSYYAIVLGVVLLAMGIHASGHSTAFLGLWTETFQIKNLSSIGTLCLVNLSIIGQDIIMWFGLGPSGALYYTPHFLKEPVGAWQYLVLPPGWSISIELLFYCTAPYLLRQKTSVLIALVVLSAIARLICVTQLGLREDPWSYRFFPLELLFFLLGALGYRFYAANKAKMEVWVPYKWWILSFVYLDFILDPLTRKAPLYFPQIFMACILPLVFFLTKRDAKDRWIGELSYPVYLVHWPVVLLIGNYTKLTHRAEFIASAIVSVLISLVLIHFVDGPIDRIRQRRVERSAAAAESAAKS